MYSVAGYYECSGMVPVQCTEPSNFVVVLGSPSSRLQWAGVGTRLVSKASGKTSCQTLYHCWMQNEQMNSRAAGI